MPLSAVRNQDSYRYGIGDPFLGANDRETLGTRCHEAMGRLGCRFSRDVATYHEHQPEGWI
jgi:hypothetical protein